MLRSQARRGEENEDQGEGGRIQGTFRAVRRDGRGTAGGRGQKADVLLLKELRCHGCRGAGLLRRCVMALIFSVKKEVQPSAKRRENEEDGYMNGKSHWRRKGGGGGAREGGRKEEMGR